jgi:hypothetical protein
MLIYVTHRLWRERMAIARKPLPPGLDPDDAKAQAANHHADLIQRFLHKARSFEDSALTLETVRHQLHHMLLLVPEHAGELGRLLSWTDRLGGKVAEARLRALEVQRHHSDKLQLTKRVKDALDVDQRKLQLIAVAGTSAMPSIQDHSAYIEDAVHSSPSTPPDQATADLALLETPGLKEQPAAAKPRPPSLPPLLPVVE